MQQNYLIMVLPNWDCKKQLPETMDIPAGEEATSLLSVASSPVVHHNP